MSNNPKSSSNSHALASVFGDIIAQAAKTAANTGATDAARRQQETRTRRLSGAGTASLILLDVSASMDERAGARRKIDILRDALAGVLPSPTRQHLIAFSSVPTALSSLADLSAPSGSTALHLALALAASHRPRHTLVVSDGRPDDETAALAEADRLPGIIDVLYVGADSDAQAMAFMRRLARAGAGRVVVHDVVRQATPAQLGTAIRGLLPAPTK